MENDVIDSLADIGYDGPLTVPDAFETALSLGPRSTQFTALVHVLTTELRNLCRLEELVRETASPDDASTFVLELSSFLKELGCPYLCLVTGHPSSRLQKKSDRLLLLDYLLAELMAVRMVAIDKPQEQSSAMDVTIHETPTAKDLRDILSALKMNAPPPNISVSVLFQKLKEKLTLVLQKEGPDYAGRPLYNQALTEKQWKQVEELHKQMVDEYRLRREMLITRLDCTIQSFEWQGDKGNKNERIEAAFRPLRLKMKAPSGVRLSDFLAARSHLLAVTKTSDAAVRVNTKSRVNTHIIGKVPDRGGRPSEQQAPPPEMPSWQNQRSQVGGRGGPAGGRGGMGGGRGGSGFGGPGGKVQGGWNPQPVDQRPRGAQGFQQDNRNNYQDNSRGHQGGSSRGGYGEGGRGGNQGGYRGGHDNRGGNQGGYSAGNQTGFSAGKQIGYSSGNQTGYSAGNQTGYSGGNQTGYQDNRSNQGGYDNNRRNSGGYQSQAAYQPPDLQHSQSFDTGNQSKGRYQNEHDDRSNNSNYSQGGSASRGRSVYNRGGRN